MGKVGIIDVTKKDLQDREGRKARRRELPSELAGYARILEEQLDLFEKELEGVDNYAGLVLRVDCSGDTERYGTIARYQFCPPIRGIVLEGVWALVRSGKGPLFAKFSSLAERMNQQSRPEGRGLLFSRSGCIQGFIPSRTP
jgi:hypothetical protein